MAKINMCFDHQVAVKVFFVNKDKIIRKPIIKYLRSDAEGILEISLDHIAKGRWKVTLEWNYEDKEYSLVKDIEIPYLEAASS
ncbi:hypothetical protein H9X96_01275 [Pedobacter sp. N36a]|uniref:hypothetical protein n=1 Tax=Pedobacter sp. N36a TaxID=2767996 RepID=UPI001656A6E3|nr:hypothetical protein [Pedobacter sp. N36a]MBC8984401.1 hypothetical protein [Pedobacter sp. N36a]